MEEKLIKNLTEVKINTRGIIYKIDTKDATRIRKLASLGIMPAADVIVIQKYPSILIQIGFTQIALDHNIAKSILVKV